MTLTRTLERLERFGDVPADDALRPPVTGPGVDPGPARPPRRSLRRTVLLAVAAALVVAVLAGYLVGFSPLLGLSQVQVLGGGQGAGAVSAERVRAAVAVAEGTPLVRVDTSAAVRRVQALPEVASATVAVSYPSTLVVTVVLRTPVVRLAGPTRLVDATGRVYLQLPAGAAVPGGLPVTTAAAGPPLALAATVAAALPTAARARVATIAVTPATAAGGAATATLTLTGGRTVLWGDASRSAEKGQLFTTLFTAGGAAVLGATVDLSSPEVVVTR